jgi:hypothetical protein
MLSWMSRFRWPTFFNGLGSGGEEWRMGMERSGATGIGHPDGFTPPCSRKGYTNGGVTSLGTEVSDWVQVAE